MRNTWKPLVALATTAEAERDGLPAPGADSSGGTDDMFAGVVGKVDGRRLKSNLQLLVLALRFGLVFGFLDDRCLEPSRRRRYIWITLGRLHCRSGCATHGERTLACRNKIEKGLLRVSMQIIPSKTSSLSRSKSDRD